ncbi:pseudouridine synthase [Helcococcus sueciensis]|uniref:pseudouridine synthase n=1 Tax=Helcococcus sueciensis TaxID=241555 RepID=UPI000403CA1A|nr:pseudouridine synthase [Helcococcus sueciensis]
MRIDKYLANMGVGTRKEVKDYISKGFILINGEVVKKATQQINENEDKIEYKNQEIIYKPYIYLMLNKPQGVISATKDYSKTVIDLLEEKYQNKDIFPVGRLDKDTEGFLLLTNDGKLAHELLSPKKKVNKKYFARVEKGLKKEDIQVFENGVYLDKENYLTKPAKLEILSDNEAYITIQEGKYHQVKRMFHAVDNSVIYLKRISMGELSLDENLKLGEYRELTDEEINLLKGE